MPYADADFFVALFEKGDRLNAAAMRTYEVYKGQIVTSLVTVIELMIVGRRREGFEATKLVENLTLITSIDGISHEKLLKAASYIDEQNMSIFDAFHAVLCEGTIISSDEIYDRIGLKRVVLLR